MFTGRKILFLVALYVNSVALGVILSWMFSSGAAHGPTDSESASFHEALSNDPTNSSLVVFSLNSGDQFFGLGDFEKAIEHYKNVLNESPADQAVQYRIALAMEASARFSTAFQMYRSIIETSSSSYLRRAAELGVVRTNQKTGNPKEAKVKLWQLFLKKDLPCSKQGEDPGFVGVVSHQLATAYAASLLNRDTRVTTDLSQPVFADLPFDAEFYLLDLKRFVLNTETEEKKETGRAEQPAEQQTNGELISQKRVLNDERQTSARVAQSGIDKYVAGIDEVDLENGQLVINLVGDAIDLEGKLLEVKARNVGMVEFFTTLEPALQTRIEFTRSAAAALNSRSIDIYLNQVDVATLMYGLTRPLDLYWVKAETGFQVATEAELTAEELHAARLGQAIHLLQSSIFDFPESRLAVGTQFIYGNLAFEQRDWSTAVGNYREAIKRRQLRNYLLQRTHFNLGKALLQLGQEEEAENAFYAAIDHSYGGDLPAAALLVVSRMHAQQGKYDTSIKTASRAVSTAGSVEFKERGAVLLSSVYVLSEKYYSANQSLVDNRSLIQDPISIQLATFISAYARFASQSNHFNEEPEDLLRSIPSDELEVEDLPHLKLLKGRALRKLGFETKSVQTLIKSYTQMRDCDLRKQIKEEISKTLLQAGPYSELTQYYGKVFATDPETASHPEVIKNAQFEYDAGNFENCKRLCEQVLDDDPEPKIRKLALRLLGQAYQRTGDPYTAATYFAGIYEKKKSNPAEKSKQ